MRLCRIDTANTSVPRIPIPYPADSAVLFERVRHLPFPVFLDSGIDGSARGRFDIIAAAPLCRVVANQGNCWLERPGGQHSPLSGTPFTALQEVLKQFGFAPAEDDLPFNGGALGYFGYDLGRTLEQLPALCLRDIDMPEMQVGIYPWAVVVDHHQACAWLICDHPEAIARQQELVSLLNRSRSAMTDPFRLTAPFRSNLDPLQYRQRFERIIDYIHAGDCYQVNLAQRFSAEYQGDSWHAYRALRQAAPTPFSAYLPTPNGDILSLSPERFIRSDGKAVETKPIKGTRPRGSTPHEDLQLAEQLANSPKDRAENLMIVDLLRNDLGRTCTTGSIRVPSLFALESYANVHHLVTTIVGGLDRPDQALELLQGAFPGGSITGAPKLRAMEIIEELEPHRRGPYCGSIGYIGFNGHMDTSICIRTLVAHRQRLHCWAGGGIVADSDGDAEYQETFTKVNNLTRCLEAQFLAPPAPTHRHKKTG